MIKVKKVNQENFKKFGGIATTPPSTPTSQSLDYKFWSDITSFKINGETEIGLCTVYKQPENILQGMERHLNTPEILIPIDAPFMLPLLLEGDEQDKLEVFKVDVGEAVVINKGVWHGACLPVEVKESNYFVIFKKGTPHSDVEKKTITSTRISD
ncbi:MAG: ureidoglycolate lyase [Melioribacteraceae bacterium]|nr:ureidoglycolate lyase [Melioribacteraceae bacterium]